MSSVLIIGASSSLGCSVMKNFSEMGYNVVATYSGAPERIICSENISSIQLDLTCDESIANFNSSIGLNGYTFDLCVFSCRVFTW